MVLSTCAATRIENRVHGVRQREPVFIDRKSTQIMILEPFDKDSNKVTTRDGEREGMNAGDVERER